MHKLGVFILAGFCVAGCKSNAPFNQVEALPEWRPLIVNYDWDDSFWNTAEGQQSINYKSGEWSAILEAKLYVVFHELMSQLDEARRIRLVAEQKSGWSGPNKTQSKVESSLKAARHNLWR